MVLLLGYGPDAPPRKLIWQRKNDEPGKSSSSDSSCLKEEVKDHQRVLNVFSWRPVMLFFLWTFLWSSYVLVLCAIYVRQHDGLQELFKRFLFLLYALFVLCYTFASVKR